MCTPKCIPVDFVYPLCTPLRNSERQDSKGVGRRKTGGSISADHQPNFAFYQRNDSFIIGKHFLAAQRTGRIASIPAQRYFSAAKRTGP
jgi:hypothetical protein